MKKMMIALMAVLITVGLVGIGTYAFFSDTETSSGNTFAAGTLDLNLDGGNTNVVKFNVSNLQPGNQPNGTWNVINVGTVNGYLDLHNITVTQTGGIFTDAEAAAGDNGNAGNLGDLLGLTLFVDVNGNGWFGAEDTIIYDAMLGGIAADYDLNLPLLAAGGSSNITMILNWWSRPDDNLGQGDTATIDMTFELGQTTGQ